VTLWVRPIFLQIFRCPWQVLYSLFAENDHSLAGFGFRRLGDFLAVHVSHDFIDQNGLAVIIVICLLP
jgi:hypothetical protein